MTQLPLPEHVAIIMDGNGRWAKAKGFPRLYGHIKGANATDKVIDVCLEKGIKVLTIFAFGFENWQRPDAEVNALQKLFYVQLRKKIKSLHKKNVRLIFIGDTKKFNERLQIAEKEAMALTQNNTALTLQIATSYSGQWDILQATKQLAQQVSDKNIALEDITPERFQSTLVTGDVPMPDLLIRTGGEQRISNFLLWQCAYAELYFPEVYWPDFTKTEFDKALTWFATRERRFGKTSQQLQGA